jgi:hypothetical protein
MDDGSEGSPVVQFRLTAAVATKRIQALAADSGNVDWSVHALDRMSERGIADIEALRVLRMGLVVEQPMLTKFSEWKCKMVRRVGTGRDVGVVVIILRDERLFVKTVEWEDLR